MTIQVTFTIDDPHLEQGLAIAQKSYNDAVSTPIPAIEDFTVLQCQQALDAFNGVADRDLAKQISNLPPDQYANIVDQVQAAQPVPLPPIVNPPEQAQPQ